MRSQSDQNLANQNLANQNLTSQNFANQNLERSNRQIKKRLAEQQMQADRMHDVQLLLGNLFRTEEVTVKKILDCLYDVGAVNLINQRFQSRTLSNGLKAIARTSKPVVRVVALRWFYQNCPKLITDWLTTQVSFQPQLTQAAQKDPVEVAEAVGKVGESSAQSTTTAAPAAVAFPQTEPTPPTALQPRVAESQVVQSQVIPPDQPAVISAQVQSSGAMQPFATSSETITSGTITSGTILSLESLNLEQRQALQIVHLSQEVRHLRTQVKWLVGLSVGAIAALGGTLFWITQAPAGRPLQPASTQSVQLDSRPLSHP